MAELKHITIQAPAGGTYVSDPRLAYVTMVSVHRNGVQHYLVDDIPTGDRPDMFHEVAAGKVHVSSDYPFNFANLDEQGARIIEYVFLVYKEGLVLIPTTP